MAQATAGVGMGPGARTTGTPRDASSSAAARAKPSDWKRVSWPTNTPRSERPDAIRWEAMAAATRRTPAKVNSSAMTARQPEVPKRIIPGCFLDGRPRGSL